MTGDDMTGDDTPRLYIGGEWRAATGAGTIPSVDPTTEQVIAQIPAGTADDVDRAVEAARGGAAAWAAQPWTERARRLRELAGRIREQAGPLADLDTREAGFPIRAMRQDAAIAGTWLHYFAGLGGELKGTAFPPTPDGLQYTRREPYGVVGRIVPYNHPLMFAAQKAAAPLMAGNAVILKPAEQASLSALALARLTEDLLPAGVLNVVTGTGAEVGNAIVVHPGIPRVAFTGSVASGRRVLRGGAEHFTHVTLELGGKNPMIVFPDADAQAAARAAAEGMNLRQSVGQSCRSTSRIFVHDRLHDRFVDALVEEVAALRVGDPRSEDTDVGPVAFREHHDRVLGYIARGREEGARLALGGGRPAGLDTGFFVEPTVFADVDPSMTVAREEIFGPVIAVLRWSDAERMLDDVNGTEYGLTANVWTNDLSLAHRTAARVEAGLVWVNGEGRVPPGVPFGGYRHSGLGKEGGLEELVSYTREKSVLVTLR